MNLENEVKIVFKNDTGTKQITVTLKQLLENTTDVFTNGLPIQNLALPQVVTMKVKISVIAVLLFKITKFRKCCFKMLHCKTDENILFANIAKITYKVADDMLYVRKLNLE